MLAKIENEYNSIKREFNKEGSIEDRMKRYEEKSNFLSKFIEISTTRDESEFVTKNSFYKRFIQWSKENKHRELAERSVGLAMKKLDIESDRDYMDWEENGKLTRKQVRVWRGLKWKDT